MRFTLLPLASVSLAALSLGLLNLSSASSSPAPVQPAVTAAIPAAPALHCQVPCGIFTDKMRIDMLMEDCATIEKAMGKIAVEPDSALAHQQIVRWIHTKEEHAQKIQDTVAQYWLAQRIKPLAADASEADQAKYHAQLMHMHHITVHAMKCKQSLETSKVEDVRKAAKAFVETYFSAEDLKHLEGHHWK